MAASIIDTKTLEENDDRHKASSDVNGTPRDLLICNERDPGSFVRDGNDESNNENESSRTPVSSPRRCPSSKGGSDLAEQDEELLRSMERLSVDVSNVVRKAIELCSDHRAKSARLEEKLKDLDDVKSEPIAAPLPKEGEPGYDLWDIDKHWKLRGESSLILASLFKNDVSDRWRNFDKLGDTEAALRRIRYRSHLEVLIQKYGISMTPRHISCLDGRFWLNDEVINFYIGMIQERNDYLVEQELDNIPKCVCFNTFFFNLLSGADDSRVEYNYQAVSRWTNRKKVDVFDVDLILIPVHAYKAHWCLGVISMREGYRHIMLFDSLHGSNRTFFKNIRRWLRDEHMHKKGKPLEDINEWTFRMDFRSEPMAPGQQNGYDCGVFMCQYAECLSLGQPFDFSQKDIPDLRVKMIQQILRGSIFE